MAPDIKLTMSVARVLKVFLDRPAEPRYGFELMQLTRLPSGTLYPILARLERVGWLTSRRESIDPAEAGRPARRFYLLSEYGAQAAHVELASLSDQLRPPPRLGGLRPQDGRA